jgi:hypothetical protein
MAHVLLQTDMLRIYFGSGVEYLSTSKHFFFNYPSRLVFGSDNPYSWIFYIVSALVLFSFLSKLPLLGKEASIVAACVIACIVTHVLPEVAGNPRHLGFLGAPFVLAMAIGAYELTRRGQRATYWPLVVLVCFIVQSFDSTLDEVRSERSNKRTCASMTSLEKGVIITDYTTYNRIENCLTSGNFKTLFLDSEGAEDITDLTRKEVLLIQARMGGLATPAMGIYLYRRKLGGLPQSRREELEEALKARARGENNVYFVTSPNREYLFPEEMNLINFYPFKKLVAPGIFWFAREDG